MLARSRQLLRDRRTHQCTNAVRLPTTCFVELHRITPLTAQQDHRQWANRASAQKRRGLGQGSGGGGSGWGLGFLVQTSGLSILYSLHGLSGGLNPHFKNTDQDKNHHQPLFLEPKEAPVNKFGQRPPMIVPTYTSVSTSSCARKPHADFGELRGHVRTLIPTSAGKRGQGLARYTKNYDNCGRKLLCIVVCSQSKCLL